MLNVDSQDWWMWQMYRATAEFMHEPNSDREAQLKFFINSYRYFHQQQNGNGAQQQANTMENMPSIPVMAAS